MLAPRLNLINSLTHLTNPSHKFHMGSASARLWHMQLIWTTPNHCNTEYTEHSINSIQTNS